eukprot:SAG11_NODE_535_length_8688_cov_2.395809_2_plen_1974_part_00
MDDATREQLIAEAFAVFDPSGDGRVSPEELAATINAMHLSIGGATMPVERALQLILEVAPVQFTVDSPKFRDAPESPKSDQDPKSLAGDASPPRGLDLSGEGRQIWFALSSGNREVLTVNVKEEHVHHGKHVRVKDFKLALNQQHGVSGVVKVRYGWEELEIRSGTRPPFHKLPDAQPVQGDPTVVYKVGYPHQFNAWVGAIGATGEDAAAQLNGLEDFQKLCRLDAVSEFMSVQDLEQGISVVKLLRRAFLAIDVDGNGVIQEYELTGFLRAIAPKGVSAADISAVWRLMDRRDDTVVVFKEFLEGCWASSLLTQLEPLLSLARLETLDTVAIKQQIYVERGNSMIRNFTALERWGCVRMAPEMFDKSASSIDPTASVPSPRVGWTSARSLETATCSESADSDNLFVNPLQLKTGMNTFEGEGVGGASSTFEDETTPRNVPLSRGEKFRSSADIHVPWGSWSQSPRSLLQVPMRNAVITAVCVSVFMTGALVATTIVVGERSFIVALPTKESDLQDIFLWYIVGVLETGIEMLILHMVLLQATARIASKLTCPIVIADKDRSAIIRGLVRECFQFGMAANDDLGVDVNRNTGSIRMIGYGAMFLFENYGPTVLLRMVLRALFCGVLKALFPLPALAANTILVAYSAISAMQSVRLQCMQAVVAEKGIDILFLADEIATISHSSALLLACVRVVALVAGTCGKLSPAHEYMIRRILRIQGYRTFLMESGTEAQKARIKEADGAREVVNWSYILTKLGAEGRQPFFSPRMYTDNVDLVSKDQLLDDIEVLSQTEQHLLLEVAALAIILGGNPTVLKQMRTNYRVTKSMASLYSEFVRSCRGRFPANLGTLEGSARTFAQGKPPTKFSMEDIVTGVDDTYLSGYFEEGVSTMSRLNTLFMPEGTQYTCRALMRAPCVETIVILVILTNSVLLGVCSPNLELSDEYRRVFDIADVGFTVFYTLEAFIRIVANGLFIATTTREGAYLETGWNKLDLGVITVAYLTYLATVMGFTMPLRVNVFRALRVLRLLHAVRFFSSTRAILTSLGQATQFLGNVIALFMFFFCVYTVLGMSLYGGALNMACVPASDSHAVVQDNAPHDMFRWGGTVGEVVEHCPPSLLCESDEVCMIVSTGLRGGFAGFDNVFASLLTMFCATTGDNWNEIAWAFLESPANSSTFGWLFLLSISFFCSLIALNIFVAVICAVFGDVRGDTVMSAFSEQIAMGYYESDDEDEEELTKGLIAVDMSDSMHAWVVERPRNWTRPFYHSDEIELLTEKSAFEGIVTTTILLNTCTMAMAYHGMPREHFEMLEQCEYVFLSIFMVEMVLKILGLGIRRYLSSNWNKMDFVVNCISMSAIMFVSPEPQATAPRMLRLFRIVRATRVARLLEKFESLRRLIRAVTASGTAIVNLYVFIVFSLCVVSLFGMHLLGDLKQYEIEGLQWIDEGTGKANTIPRTTFDDFVMAFGSSFLMMTGDRWKGTMYTYMQTHGVGAALFFVLVFLGMSCIMVNLFVAVVLENFSLEDGEKFAQQARALQESMRPTQYNNMWRKLAFMTPLRRSIERAEKDVGEEFGVALFIFKPDNSLRQLCTTIRKSIYFEFCIMGLIAISAFTVAVEGRPGSLDPDSAAVLGVVDSVLLGFFWSEVILRSISRGFIFTKDAYITDTWNKIDFIVVVLCTFVTLVPSLHELQGVVRLGRLIRPLRLLDQLEGMHTILKALWESLPDLMGVVFLQLVFFVMFGIIGMNIFTGKFFRCDDGDVYGRADCVGTYVSHGELSTPYWENPGFSFDNLLASMKTLFIVSTMAGWSEVMYVAMDVTTVDVQPQRDVNKAAVVFFVAFIFICSFAVVNLFIGVLVHLFGVSSGRGLQTSAQRKWSLMKILVSQMRPTNVKIRRKKGFRGLVYDVVMHDSFDAFITLVIIFNVTVMMSNFTTEPSWWATTIESMNMICLTIFTVSHRAQSPRSTILCLSVFHVLRQLDH